MLTILMPTLWIGMLIGISLIATPVKFTAAGLTRPVALAIGRATFILFSRIEWGLASLLLGIYVAMDGAVWRLAVSVAIAGLVILQSAWLLPALNRRVTAVVSGDALAPSHVHRIYAVVEGVKLLALLTLVVSGIAVLDASHGL